jgi:hypothetical protein
MMDHKQEHTAKDAKFREGREKAKPWVFRASPPLRRGGDLPRAQQGLCFLAIFAQFFASFALGPCFLSCGYAPVRRVASHQVQVAAVRNQTAQAEAGGIFAAELRSELAGRGRLAGGESAAPELTAELIELRSVPTAAASEGAAAFRLDAELRLRIGDYADAVVGGEDYLAGVDVLGTEANRRAALRRLARVLAREAIERYEVSERMGPR